MRQGPLLVRSTKDRAAFRAARAPEELEVITLLYVLVLTRKCLVDLV